jgi:hypothetical protein
MFIKIHNDLSIDLDNEAKKAIRFSLGLNTDLRIKMKGVLPRIEGEVERLVKNKALMQGIQLPTDPLDEGYDVFERKIRHAACEVASL